jgi:hypothetical protein
MANILNLPEEIIILIKDFLWGNVESHKKRFSITLKENFSEIKRNLIPAPYCIFSGNLLEIEDEMFCEICGEKTVFPFTRDICYTCEYYETGNTNFIRLDGPSHQYF